MKKLFFCTLFGLISWGLSAQQIPDEFLKFFQENNDEISAALKAGDFPRAEELTIAIHDKIDLMNAQEQDQLKGIRAHLDYNLACVYALWGKPEKAVDALTRSIDYGYQNYRHILQDSDFDSIRDYPPFQEQVNRLSEFDYQKILQKAAPYRAGTPEFEYQSADAEELQALRREFALDSIAGNGSELDRMKNLMTWLHNTVRHDGSNPTDTIRTASALIGYAARTGRGVNCRMLAISLNEIYLAMGYPSRYVTCLPKSSTDPDCHVINSVWSETLGKWVWMDPSFDQWVTDENGTMLSIEEVRQRAIDGRPLLVNPEGNWNNENPSTKESYLDAYMFKNLYWLQVPDWSGYGVEARLEGRPYPTYVSLTPPGFYGFNMGRNSYVTHDPDYFWQKPR